ncbi:sodium-dependent multivitamin transporter-like isoform X2 [Phlebotomus papatasi]|uniref:sodium-dependent multivitamin transporter-like isoform X2 n=1 Tax=Phlebotomus papatasi TaxID=29031 RepID=UPI002483BDE7|nr:sodium-dependent multivitamin transporter-like isoform X2 [Phlebotomus papatasi]
MVGLSDFSEFLSTPDYGIVFLMLVISMGIGFYHGLKKRKVLRDEIEYLMAGKSMSVVPVSLSILASSVSGLCLIGFSTEMYLYGSAYLYGILNIILAIAFFNKFLLPVFHALEITSIYNYLEKRFNRRVRIFGSCTFVILATLYMPILLYMPSLAFNQVTGIDMKVTAAVLTIIVIFYTCIGGFRATVWTDVFQTVVMCSSVIIVIVKGYVDLVEKIGLSAIFQKSHQTNRYEFPTLYYNDVLLFRL